MEKKPISLSKRFRRQVYLELAGFFAIASTFKTHTEAGSYLYKKGLSEYICVNLEYHCPFAPKDKETGSQTREVKLSHFEEFNLFEPNEVELSYEESAKIGGGWWSVYDIKGFEERADVLFLCAEMCK